MSVIITAKITGDTSAFAKSLQDRADDYRKWGERGREAGALHHQFAIGEGFVLVIDEWDSPAAFQKFFSDPEIQAFVGSVGGNTDVAPEITVGESVDSPDRY